MDSLKKIILFLILSLSIFATENSANRVNTLEERVKEVERQIKDLESKRKELEMLKQAFKNNKNVERPKIGLVLSGGGAKGAAHIGVLKTLEKYQIPIDYIVGTSAGSIIAAMYSVGYTPDEIEKTITDLRFYELFRNSSNRSLEGIIQKTQNKYPITVSITKDFNLSLPMGVFNGQYIYLELKKIFARAENVTDFKDFPIPFRAMTTNLQTGESVELNSGDLALATLKSMAIPTFLDPVREGDNFYVDGGVADNFPVLQALDMGANIIIGVDIAADPIVISDDSNIIQILNKLASYNSDRNTETQLNYPDILITPDVKDHSTLDFDNLPKLVKEGEIAAEKLDFALSKLTDEKRYNEIKLKKERMKKREFDIKNVTLQGNSLLTVREVENLRPAKGELDVNKLNLWTEKIFARNFIDRVFYTVDDNTVDFTIRENMNTKVKAGLFYISNYGAGLELVADVPVFDEFNLSQKNYTLKSEISKYPKISLTDMTQYTIMDYKLLVSASLGYGLNPIFLYKDGDNVSTYENRVFETSFSIGTTILNNIISGYTLSFKNLDTKYSSGQKIEDFEYFKKNGSYFTNSFSFYYDTMNKSEYATKGTQGLFQVFSEIDAKEGESFEGYSIMANKYFPLSDDWSLNTGISGGQIYNSKKAPLSELFNLGGLRNNPIRKNYAFVGLPIASVYTDNFMIGNLGLQYKIVPNLYLNLNYNVATYNYYSGFGREKNIWDGEKQGYGVGIGWDTFLGPMDFSVSNNVLDNDLLFQVHIGYVF